ncbi:hypothetical protein CCACVL1_24816 [Corchorus capsularis]|uniref:Uncharacterized protein n=1 Tax=Corchorus capsularis TaxID=210143 RepID=A0A1R3GMW5_COCAP|nr:hypothetical protein CCACVL1_24816 [Corchorus capsularis]
MVDISNVADDGLATTNLLVALDSSEREQRCEGATLLNKENSRRKKKR